MRGFAKFSETVIPTRVAGSENLGDSRTFAVMRCVAEPSSQIRARYAKRSEATFCITRLYTNLLFDNIPNLHIMRNIACLIYLSIL